MTRILQLRWLDETEWKNVPGKILVDSQTVLECARLSQEIGVTRYGKHTPQAEFRVIEVLDE